MMTKQTEALKILLDSVNGDCYVGQDRERSLVKIIRESLEQPAQEPIGYIGVITLQRIKSNYSGIDGYGISLKKLLENDIPLYTHPAPSWKGLNDDEKTDYIEAFYCSAKSMNDLVDTIEQALKEKNK